MLALSMRQFFYRVFLLCALTLIARAQGIITTIAGADFPFTGDGMLAINTSLGSVTGVATDVQGNVYFTDLENHRVFQVGADGVLRVIAGNGVPGYSGD